MLSLSKLLQQNSKPGGFAPVVDSLLQRVTESALADDRREALQQLRDLLTDSPAARAALGSVGLPLVCSLIRDSRDDVELLRLALECLAAAVAPASPQEAGGATVNAEQLLRDPECVPLLLSFLDVEPLGVGDFYVRFFTLDVLKGLLAANAQLMRECVLAAPLGVVRVVGVLGEQDALRNEALLLLQQLVLGNAELQKMAAFEGAFDRALAILGEEGLLEGGIVVHDCLLLLVNLLRGSPANQLMFREMGFLSQLLSLVAAAAKLAGSVEPGSQECHNLTAALQVLAVLVAPQPPLPTGNTSHHTQNRDFLSRQQFLQLLLSLVLGSSASRDSFLRAQAFACLALMLSSEAPHQPGALGAGWQQQQQQPLESSTVSQLVVAALYAGSDAEQVAADAVLEAVYSSSAEVQAAAARSLSSPEGQQLMQALTGDDAELCSRAASVVSYIVRDNPPVRLQLAQQLGRELSHCTRQLASMLLAPQRTASRQAPQRLLRLLLSWLPGCEVAVAGFLAAAAAAPFLVGVVSGTHCEDFLLRGLNAALLGLAAVVPRSPSSSQQLFSGLPSAAMLTDAIKGQIGLEQFTGLLQDLRQRLVVVGSAEAGTIPLGHLVTLAYHQYVDRLVDKVFQGLIGQPHRVAGATAAAEGAASSTGRTTLPAAVPVQVAQQFPNPPLAQLALAKGSGSQNLLAGGKSQPGHVTCPSPPVSTVAPAPCLDSGDARDASQPDGLGNGHVNFNEEINQLEQQVQQSRQESESYKAEVLSLNETIRKLESELEGLSNAYAMLEAHSRDVQAQLECQRALHEAAKTSSAQLEGDEGDPLEDLLICLGQEEAKVARLSAALRKLGSDPEGLLLDMGGRE